MTVAGWLEIALFLAVLTALTPLVGGYMARVFTGEVGTLGFVERPLYRLLGVRRERGQDWKAYARSVLVFSALCFGLLYLVLRTQTLHPFNPQDLVLAAPGTSPSTPPRRSCRTRTGSSTPARRRSRTSRRCSAWRCRTSCPPRSGSRCSRRSSAGWRRAPRASWATSTSTSPACCSTSCSRSRCIGGLFLDVPGRAAEPRRAHDVHTLTGLEQTLAQGPVASQEAIKLLGTNGGGFFNVNSAMPFENPTWLTNFVEMLMILVIPAGLTATYGRMVGSRRQGWAVFAAMMSAVRRRRRARLRRRGPPDARDARRRRLRPEHGGQGAALRHRVLLAVRRGHHGRLLRRGQRGDGVAQRARRRRPDERDDDRRGDLGRGRLGPLRDAAVRRPRRCSSPA